ncbi:MAG: (2Fe-2S)-binding protein [Candidatus Rokubacteria bacterium]|nr:(2Fe-2S)-binding protein [Candidatus Rokubacteria bacterium]
MSARGLRTTTAGARGARVGLVVDGRPVEAYAGESVAAALLAAGLRTFRTTDRDVAPRSYYCGMGVCHDCLVAVDGVPYVRACLTPVREGMRVESQPSLRVEKHT